MNDFFLYRLFKHSKIFFAIIVIFLCCYAVLFFKKMDMLFFPYNDMFSHAMGKEYTSSTYAVKINRVPLKITNRLYWKKDFLEESLNNYGKYKKHENLLFLSEYLKEKIPDAEKRKFYIQRLIPDTTAAEQWLSWYTRFAGKNIAPGDSIELVEYNFIFENNAAFIKDSTSIYKTHVL